MSMRRKVLVADDDPMAVELVVAALHPLGLQIAAAATGEEALRQAEEIRPDLIVLDVLMPGGHGFAVCKALRERREFDKTRILFLTSKAYGADRHQAMALGADVYLSKPFSIEELRQTVTSLLGE